MKPHSAETSSVPPGILPLLAGVCAVWWLAIRMLWTDWEIDPQYGYGFLVPMLCAALFLQRWSDRPEPEPPQNLLPNAILALPPLLFLTAVQPFFEANPEWRIPGMLGALAAVSLTCILLHAMGGRPWLGHFFFPAEFFLIAVPWPRNAEEAFMGFLMEKNAAATLEVLHWCGYEAVRRGNLIALPTGLLGVEEACSGVRSLQSGLMASLFFGEVFRFGVFARSALVFLALAFAVAGNFLRATALSLIASTQGLAAVDKWHDTAGYAALAFTLGALWLAAIGWQRIRNRTKTPMPAPDPGQAPAVPHALRVAGLAGLGLAATSLVGTEAWYRLHERNAPPPLEWTVREGTPGTKPVSVADRTKRILFFPEGFSERFRDPAGRQWQFFYFRWPAGRTAVQAIDIHNPRTCLGSIGLDLVRQLPPVEIRAAGATLPFNVYLFSDQGRPILVFHSIIADRPLGSHDRAMDALSGGSSLSKRWAAVAGGSRNSGQRLLEAAVWGTENVPEATDTLRRFLEQSVVTGGAAVQQ